MSRFSLLLLTALCTGSFLSCTEQTDLSSTIPNNSTGVGVINLPAIKSKALSWDLLYDYIFSDDKTGKEQPDWSIDIDRKAYVYTSAKAISINIPILDEKTFGKALASLDVTEAKSENGFSYVQKDQFYIGWKKDLAVVSNDTSFLHASYFKPENKLVSEATNAEQDIFFTYNGEVLGAQQSGVFNLDFNDGEIDIKVLGPQLISLLEKYAISGNVRTKKIKKNYDAFLSVPLKKHNLKELMLAGMPILQEHGLLFNDQFKAIYSSLDGRIHLGFEDSKINNHAKAQLMLGLNSDGKNGLDSTFLSGFTLDNSTGFYTDKENFQFFKLQEDYIIFSNTNEPIEFEPKVSFISLDIKRKAIKDDYLFFPKMLLGAEAVDNFPVSEIDLNTLAKEKASGLVLNLKIKLNDQEKNSLVSIIEYLSTLQNTEEI